MTEITPSPAEALDLARRALGHVLDVDPSQLREDSPLPDLGADSVAVLVFADVVEAFAATAGLSGFAIDEAVLLDSRSVGDLAMSISWRAASSSPS
ncbi:MAG: acyl carrier protein [Actinobacteria bacterium]|nr:acyl carrier protein [Actinomycetota bacterium]